MRWCVPPDGCSKKAAARFRHEARKRFDASVELLRGKLEKRLGAVADRTAHRALSQQLTEALILGQPAAFDSGPALADYALRRLKPRCRVLFDVLIADESRGALRVLLEGAEIAHRLGRNLRVASLGGGPGFDAAATVALLAALVIPEEMGSSSIEQSDTGLLLESPVGIKCDVLDLYPDWAEVASAMDASLAELWGSEPERANNVLLVAPVDLRSSAGSVSAIAVEDAIGSADLVVVAYVLHENEVALLEGGDTFPRSPNRSTLGGVVPLIFAKLKRGSVLLFVDATHRLWPNVIATAQAVRGSDDLELVVPTTGCTAHAHALVFVSRLNATTNGDQGVARIPSSEDTPLIDAQAKEHDETLTATLQRFSEHQRLHSLRAARLSTGVKEEVVESCSSVASLCPSELNADDSRLLVF